MSQPFEKLILRKATFYTSYDEPRKQPDEVENIDNANIVTSKVKGTINQHKPVLDIDFPATLIPSSTPGHFHLFLDREMSWFVYEKLLYALADAGILEEGYVGASIQRGYTAVRLPWIKK
jgi:hypothetical protein